jgi:hypothetical protein
MGIILEWLFEWNINPLRAKFTVQWYTSVCFLCLEIQWKFIHSFIHSFVCLMTGPQLLPKWVLFSASNFNFQYPLVSLRSSISCLCHLFHIPVTAILPSTTFCRRQFIHKMWPFQLAVLFTLCRKLRSSLTLCNTSAYFTWSAQLISGLFWHHISKLARYFS